MSYEYPVGRSIARKMEPVFLEARLNPKPLVRRNGGKNPAWNRIRDGARKSADERKRGNSKIRGWVRF